MVNAGKPSNGCFLCRKRRVKCDERKPACLRCEKLGRTCPGYRTQAAVLFRDQNDWAAHKVRRRIAVRDEVDGVVLDDGGEVEDVIMREVEVDLGGAGGGRMEEAGAGEWDGKDFPGLFLSGDDSYTEFSLESMPSIPFRGRKSSPYSSSSEASSSSGSSDTVDPDPTSTHSDTLVHSIDATTATTTVSRFSALPWPVFADDPYALFPRPLFLAPEVIAVERFYIDYSLPGTTPPILGFVADMCDDVRAEPCLRSAVRAVAVASMGKQMRSERLLGTAARHYGAALRELAEAIKHPTRAKSDDVLTTVSMLGLHEQVIADTENTQAMRDVHFQGGQALLRLRGREQLKSRIGKLLFKMVRHQQLISALIHGKDSDCADFDEWESEIDNGVLLFQKKEPPTFEMLLVAVTQHCSTMAGLLNDLDAAAADRAATLGHMQTGFRLDNEIGLYCTNDGMATTLADLASNPRSCPGIVEIAQCLPQSKGKLRVPSRISDFAVPQAILYNQIRTVRVRLLQVLLRAANALSKRWPDLDFSDVQAGLRTVSARMVEEMCTSIPTIIPGYDGEGNTSFKRDEIGGAFLRGHWMTWPLGIAVTAEGISEETRNYIRGVLAFVGSEIGLGVATVFSSREATDRYLAGITNT